MSASRPKVAPWDSEAKCKILGPIAVGSPTTEAGASASASSLSPASPPMIVLATRSADFLLESSRGSVVKDQVWIDTANEGISAHSMMQNVMADPDGHHGT